MKSPPLVSGILKYKGGTSLRDLKSPKFFGPAGQKISDPKIQGATSFVNPLIIIISSGPLKEGYPRVGNFLFFLMWILGETLNRCNFMTTRPISYRLHTRYNDESDFEFMMWISRDIHVDFHDFFKLIVWDSPIHRWMRSFVLFTDFTILRS